MVDDFVIEEDEVVRKIPAAGMSDRCASTHTAAPPSLLRPRPLCHALGAWWLTRMLMRALTRMLMAPR